MTKYYVDINGNYLGGFDGAEPPQGAIEVSNPPENGNDTWNGNTWVENFVARRKAMLPLSAKQVRKVLTRFNLRATVENAIAQADQDTKDEYYESNEFERDNPVLLGMAQSLGMTDEQLDQMFALGVTL